MKSGNKKTKSGKSSKKEKAKQQERLVQRGLASLSPFQRDIFDELTQKQSGGMALKMGVGKTRLSLILGMYYGGRSLVICSINQTREWKKEIKKVFGHRLKYEILSPKLINVDDWQIKRDTQVVIVTREILAKRYKTLDPGYLHVIRQVNIFGREVNDYQTAQHPIFDFDEEETGIRTLYTQKWDALFIDEVSDYYNLTKPRALSLCAICAEHRWGLSGDILTNPKPIRALGFYCLIDDKEMPRNVPELTQFMTSPHYRGIDASCVVRTENPAVEHIEIITHIVHHSMFPNEQKVYVTFKETVRRINERIEELRGLGNTEEIKRLTSSLLAVITYLRQSLLCPLLPIANIALQMADYEAQTELAQAINDEIGRLRIEDWLNDEDSVYSSRLRMVVTQLDNIQQEMGDQRVLIFTSHRTSVNLLSYYIMNREVLVVEPKMKPQRREQVLDDFESTKNGVLLYTYQMGSKGLNLQTSCHIVFFVDFEWADADTNQAGARVVRPGQESNKVYFYYFTSNTGVESVVLRTQLKKRKVINQMRKGPVKRLMKSSKLAEFVDMMIKVEDNIRVVEKLYFDMETVDVPAAEGAEGAEGPEAENVEVDEPSEDPDDLPDVEFAWFDGAEVFPD